MSVITTYLNNKAQAPLGRFVVLAFTTEFGKLFQIFTIRAEKKVFS